MKTDKIKNRILYTLKEPNNYLSRIELLPDVPKEEALIAIQELIEDGYVELTFEAVNGNPVIELTSKGVIFIREGAYSKRKRIDISKKTLSLFWKCMLTILGIICTILFEEYVRYMLKDVF